MHFLIVVLDFKFLENEHEFNCWENFQKLLVFKESTTFDQFSTKKILSEVLQYKCEKLSKSFLSGLLVIKVFFAIFRNEGSNIFLAFNYLSRAMNQTSYFKSAALTELKIILLVRILVDIG